MATAINRTLYIGLGGTGAQTLAKIKSHVINSYGEVPPMISFLAIDTDQKTADTAVATTADGRDVRLEANELCMVTVADAMGVYADQKSQFAWMPAQNVGALAAISSTGTGGVRSNGCFIARYNRGAIERAIGDSLNRVLRLVSPDSKFVPSSRAVGDPSRTTINVVCSTAGGTGSGMLFDVLLMSQDIARQFGQRWCNIIPWIVLPDGVGDPANAYCNTYCTLRDLDFVYQCCFESPLPFGDGSINERPFKFAYIVSNVNSAGATLNTLGDIEDYVAKCAFVPATSGMRVNELMDNIICNIPCRAMGGKQAWAVSAGAAERMESVPSQPIFALSNFNAYEAEYEKGGLSCSIDCGLDNLREAMGFSMRPAEKPRGSLDMWTQAFCFNERDGLPIVRYDKEKKQYCIISRQFGRAIENYRFDLGPNRALAFKMFEAYKLYEEVKNVIDRIISDKGKMFVDDRLDSFRGSSLYVDECVFGNCSLEEADGLKNQDPAYEDVLALVTKEIELRTK